VSLQDDIKLDRETMDAQANANLEFMLSRGRAMRDAEYKQRLERIATAVLAGMERDDRTDAGRAIIAVNAARALIAAIDKEPTDA